MDFYSQIGFSSGTLLKNQDIKFGFLRIVPLLSAPEYLWQFLHTNENNFFEFLNVLLKTTVLPASLPRLLLFKFWNLTYRENLVVLLDFAGNNVDPKNLINFALSISH